MRRVLIISPHFPPVNAPDMHRVRLALPFFKDLGWEATVLAVAPETIEGAVLEPTLVETYPADIRVVRVRGISPHLTRPLGFGSLWWRAGSALRRAGDRLLAENRFDLVFFSTTQFPVFTLGPHWRTRFGVPYVLDYQDPWINDHYARTGARPPGGWLRFRVAQWNALRHEARVIRSAAAIITVSPAYGPALQTRYPELPDARFRQLPFGASAADFAIARQHPPAAPLVHEEAGVFNVVYTGRCVPGMAPALTLLFRALRLHLDRAPSSGRRFRFYFIGTDYAPAAQARPMVLPLAALEGVADHVFEHPPRIPYFEALHYLDRSDAILVLGSDDTGYNASKLYPCLLAARPLLCIAHSRSPIYQTARQYTPDSTFASDCVAEAATAETERLALNWLGGDACLHPPSLAPDALLPHTSETMTRHLAEVFAQAPNSSRT